MPDRVTPTNPDENTAPVRCPVCRSAMDPGVETFPFCGPRCRKIDLGRWLDEGYRISRPLAQRDLDED